MPGGDKVFLLCLFPYGSIIEIFYFFRGKAFRVQKNSLYPCTKALSALSSFLFDIGKFSVINLCFARFDYGIRGKTIHFVFFPLSLKAPLRKEGNHTI